MKRKVYKVRQKKEKSKGMEEKGDEISGNKFLVSPTTDGYMERRLILNNKFNQRYHCKSEKIH